MTNILVTGASGDIGRKTVLHLLERMPATDIIALVRDPAKAADLAALGVEVRTADYFDAAAVVQGLRGVDRVMLTSTHAFTDRRTAQGNIIDGAVKAGVKNVVSMSIARHTPFIMKDITEDDLYLEEKLKTSGLTWTLVEHPPFMDVLFFYIGNSAHKVGLRMPAGEGKFAAASRDDLAAAHAAILTGSGHENKTYKLTGDPAFSFRDIACYLSKIHGKDLPYITVSNEDFLALKRETGFPEFLVQFGFMWVQRMNAGDWALQTNTLERLIGRKPITPETFFRDHYPSPLFPSRSNP